MMHEPGPFHKLLNAAANEAMQAARNSKSPLMEKLAIGAMVFSAVVSTALGAVEVVRMNTHDKERAEEKASQRIKREREVQDRATRPETSHARRR
jgi:hypothetical protein